MTEEKLPNLELRNAQVPYKLMLNRKTGLPDLDDLLCPVKPRVSKYNWVDYKPIQFKRRTLTLESTFDRKAFNQEITINEDHILVSCNCRRKITKLCPHVIGLFTKMLNVKKYNYFKRYQSYPFTENEFYEKYLILKSDYRSVCAVPKPEFGNIYKYESGIDVKNFKAPQFCHLLPARIDEEGTALVYTMGLHYRLEIPFLMLCSANLDKESGFLLNFTEFLDPVAQVPRLSPEQKLLLEYYKDFDQLIGLEHIGKKHYHTELELEEMTRIAFNYWKVILPVLKLQKNVFRFKFYNKIKYKSKPPRREMLKISFNDDQARFQFLFTEHPDYYQLKCKVLVANEPREIANVFPSENPFFFSLKPNPEVYFQFSTLEEGRMIAEFTKSGNCFTILKPDLESFNAEVLAKLVESYIVDFQMLADPIVCELDIVEKQIRMEQKDDYVWFIPSVIYSNGLNIPVATEGVKMLEFENNTYQILQRKKIEEEQFKTLFLEQHPAFKKQSGSQSFYLSKGALAEYSWLGSTIIRLAGFGISFIGFENLTNVDVHVGAPDIDIDVNAENDNFDIAVSVKFGNVVLSPEEIQNALKRKSSILQLSNGKVAHLPETFFKQLNSVFRNGTLTEKGVKVAGQHYTLIDQLYNKLEKPALTQTIAERTQLLEELETMPLINPPENLNAKLRPYQVIGFSWMVHLHALKWGGLLADDMGLGKTLQVLTLLQYLKNQGLTTVPHLLIAPTSLLFNWMEEAAKFCPGLNVIVFHGLDREKDPKELIKYDLIITSYGTAAIDIDFLKDISFQYLILDEAQAIKNPYAQKFKMVQLIKAQNRLALTGTPVENSSIDLYALLSFINPGFFGSLKMFKQSLIAKEAEQDGEKVSALLKMTKPFILRRTKNQVATDLPPKTEMTIWCEMQPTQRKIYDTYRRRFKTYLTDKIEADGLEKSKLVVLDGLMKLRQICNSPVLVKDAPPFDGSSCKIAELMEHITEKTTGHKLLVFSQFTGMLGLIKTELEQQKIGFAYLDGKTTLNKRKDAVYDFQHREDCRVFLISLKAGGTGLNLTAADYVYLVDPWWNPAVEAQAIDRCYRIGQDKQVMAYRMICKDTLEEQILQIQEKKKQLAGELIHTEESVLKSLGKDALLKLFS